MNLDHDYVQVWKFSEDQKKKKQMEHFFSQIQVKTPKKSSSKIEHFFSPNSGEDQKKKKRSSTRTEHFFPQIYDQMYTHSNYWGGIQPNYWGDISPSPLVSAPLYIEDYIEWLGYVLLAIA